MKLFEIMKLNNRQFAFWQNSSGPNNTPGVSLHYIQDNEEWQTHLRKKAKDQGDDKWLARIEAMAARDSGKKYTHPDIGWWASKEDYDADKEGFGGVTKKQVERDNPSLKIYSSGADAAKAAGY